MSTAAPAVENMPDRVKRLLEKSKVDPALLPKTYKSTGATRLPLCSVEPFNRELSNGRVVSDYRNCADLHPEFHYALLTEARAAKAEFRGYIPVTKWNDGGKGILATEFDEFGLISVGPAVWHYATKEFADSAKNAHRDRGNAAQARYLEGRSSGNDGYQLTNTKSQPFGIQHKDAKGNEPAKTGKN